MKFKTGTLKGEKVKILRHLLKKISQPGKVDKFVDLVDSEGTWVIAEFTTGKKAGNRIPIPIEKIKI